MIASLSRYHLAHVARGPFMVPLGGCGQFGANLTLLGSGGRWIAIDCGLSTGTTHGTMSRSVPSLQALEQLDIRLEALLITHGHEDHIGAIPYLWTTLNCPIYATPYTLRLIQNKFSDHPVWPDLRQIHPLTSTEIGPARVEWIPVTHSIPDSHGLLIELGGRRIYHTGDWKLDSFPVVGALTAETRLKQIGREGLDVVIGDSTNATVRGASRSEQAVAEALRPVVAQASGRLVAACFASNVARLVSLVTAGQRAGRRAALLGRSLDRHVATSRFCDYWDRNLPLLRDWELGYLPREEQLWLVTGSQGEPGAALHRLAQDRHPVVSFEAGDTLLLSARTIPGNEASVRAVIAMCQARGVQVLSAEDYPELHASGHPTQHDLETLYCWLKPTIVIPVHGEQRHQQAHASLAEQMGASTALPINGDVLDLSARAEIRLRVPAGLHELAPNATVAGQIPVKSSDDGGRRRRN